MSEKQHIEEQPIEKGPIEEGPIEEGPIEEGPIEEEEPEPIGEGPLALLRHFMRQRSHGHSCGALRYWLKKYNIFLRDLTNTAKNINNILNLKFNGKEKPLYSVNPVPVHMDIKYVNGIQTIIIDDSVKVSCYYFDFLVEEHGKEIYKSSHGHYQQLLAEKIAELVLQSKTHIAKRIAKRIA